MTQKRDRKPRAAGGFLVDENVPAGVSDFIASLGYKVAHIGRSERYLLAAPPKGTPDSLLKKGMQRLVLITEDQGLLKVGALPSKHRGVFVIDPAGFSTLSVVSQLFQRTRWGDDPILVGRRFRVGPDYLIEIGPDGEVTDHFW